MAKLTRKLLKVFGSSGGSSYFEQFGSYVAAAQLYTKDIEQIQALSAWLNGWQNAVVLSNKAPLLEDMNAVMLVLSYQSAYLLQEGVPEWSATTTYYIGSIVKKTGTFELYGSLVDTNLNQTLPSRTSDANWEWLNPPAPTTLIGNGIQDGLVVQTNASTPNSQVDVDATLLSVEGVALTGVNLTASILSSGVNGLDTGSPASSTWYAVHVICNAAGTSVAALLSLSASAPTLPTGYTKFRRVGWVRNNASGNFVKFYKADKQSNYIEPEDNLQTNPGAGTSWSAYVPPTARLAGFVVRVFTTSGFYHDVKTPSASSYTTVCSDASNNGTASFEWLLNASQVLDHQSLGSATHYVVLVSYKDNV